MELPPLPPPAEPPVDGDPASRRRQREIAAGRGPAVAGRRRRATRRLAAKRPAALEGDDEGWDEYRRLRREAPHLTVAHLPLVLELVEAILVRRALMRRLRSDDSKAPKVAAAALREVFARHDGLCRRLGIGPDDG